MEPVKMIEYKNRRRNQMNFERLEKDICYVIKEEQIKLGYRSEVIRLYYPLQTLNRLLGTESDVMEMNEVLKRFVSFACDRLGEISISNRKERFCLCLPPAASEYVNAATPKEGFLYDLIRTSAQHGIGIGAIRAVFDRYSLKVHEESFQDKEFDYLFYFEDGKPDDNYYCFKEEAGHLIYHRFSKEDYMDF